MSPSTHNLGSALSALVDLKDAYREHLGAVWSHADAGGFNPSNVDRDDDEDGDEELEDEVGRTYTAVEDTYQSAFLAVTALMQEVAFLKAAAAGDESISIRRPDDGSKPNVSTVYIAVYRHRHGEDICAYATEAAALKARDDVADEQWSCEIEGKRKPKRKIGKRYFGLVEDEKFEILKRVVLA
jgi:hypothetical protein